MGRPIGCLDANAPSIASAGMLLKFSLGCRQSLSDSQPLSSRALYRLFSQEAASDGLIGELGVTEAEARLLWPWAPQDEVSQ